MEPEDVLIIELSREDGEEMLTANGALGQTLLIGLFNKRRRNKLVLKLKEGREIVITRTTAAKLQVQRSTS